MSEEINVQFVELEQVMVAITEPQAINVTITGALPPTPVGNLKSGLDALKSASPDSGDVYLATDTGIFYLCFTLGTWSARFILSPASSGEHQIKSIVRLANGSWKVIYEGTPEP